MSTSLTNTQGYTRTTTGPGMIVEEVVSGLGSTPVFTQEMYHEAKIAAQNKKYLSVGAYMGADAEKNIQELYRRAKAEGWPDDFIKIQVGPDGKKRFFIVETNASQEFFARHLTANKKGLKQAYATAETSVTHTDFNGELAARRRAMDNAEFFEVDLKKYPKLTPATVDELYSRALNSGWTEDCLLCMSESCELTFPDTPAARKFIAENIQMDGTLKPWSHKGRFVPQTAQGKNIALKDMYHTYQNGHFMDVAFVDNCYEIPTTGMSAQELKDVQKFYEDNGIKVRQANNKFVISDADSIERTRAILEKNHTQMKLLFERTGSVKDYLKIPLEGNSELVSYLAEHQSRGHSFQSDGHIYVERGTLNRTKFQLLETSPTVSITRAGTKFEEFFEFASSQKIGRMHDANGVKFYEHSTYVTQPERLNIVPKTPNVFEQKLPLPPKAEVPQELKTEAGLKKVAREYKLNGKINFLHCDSNLDTYYHLKGLGLNVRMYKGKFVLFEEHKAKRLLTQLDMLENGVANYAKLKDIKTQPISYLPETFKKKMAEMGVKTEIIVQKVDGKNQFFAAYPDTPENRQKIYTATRHFEELALKDKGKLNAYGHRQNLKGEIASLEFDTPTEAGTFTHFLKSNGINCASYGAQSVVYEQEAAQALLTQLGMENDPNVLKNLGAHRCYSETEAYYMQQELAKNDVKAGVKKLKNGEYNLIYQGKEADVQPLIERLYRSSPYKNRNVMNRRGEPAYIREGDRMHNWVQTHRVDEGADVKPTLPEKVALKVKPVTDAVKKVSKAKDAALAAGANAVKKIPGGAAALQGARVAAKAAKTAGPVATMAMCAIDPNGTAEFVTDVAHLRMGKIVSETYDGISALVTNPGEVASAVWDATSTAVSEHYEGAESAGDYAYRTATGAGKGFLNIGDSIWMSIGGARSATAKVGNAVLDAVGSDVRIDTSRFSPEEYKKDPLGYVMNLRWPAIIDTKTGLRSDDTAQSVINRNDGKAMEALIQKKGTGVLASATENTKYTKALAMAIGMGKMDAARAIYKNMGPRSMELDGENKLTGENIPMLLLEQTALERESSDYLRGVADLKSYTPKARQNHLYAQAMLDDIFSDPKKYTHYSWSSTDNEGNTMFMLAARAGNISVAKRLDELNVRTNDRNKKGQNALHLACDNQLMVATLLDMGVSANVVDNTGKTPLMLALKSNQNNVSISLLLDATDKAGIDAMAKSPEHMALLNKWLSEKPEVRVAILSSKNHPLKDVVASYYPQEAAELRGEETKPNLNNRLASVSETASAKPDETTNRQGTNSKTAPKKELAQR